MKMQNKMINKYFSLPGNLVGRITSNSKLKFGKLEEMMLKAYVPGLEMLLSPKKADLTIHHKESGKKSLEYSGDSITIQGKWKGRVSMDLYHLLYSATRLKLINKGLYAIHASCFDNGGLILIVGHSGSGKSRITLKLLEQKRAKVLSGNKTVVSFDEENLYASAGTKVMTTKTRDLPKGNTAESVSYGDRSAFILEDDKYAPKGKVKGVVLVRLNDGRNGWEGLNPTSALHILYPLFLDTVNADTIVGEEAVYDGNIASKDKRKLTKNLKKTLIHIPVYSGVGSLTYLTRKVKSL
jgi:hypothetical protein